MAKSDREDGGGLSLRTLVVASAASLTAAMVTSRLFPPGTIYASALTPVIVAAVSEMLHKPADRVTRLREQRRTMVLESRRLQTARVHGDEPSPLRGAPDFALGADAPQGNGANGAAAAPPVRIHGRGRGARRVHPKVWIATGVAAFAIAAAALTLPELIFGGAVATKHRTTFFGGSGTSTQKQETTTQPTTTQEAPATVTETVPAQTPPASTDTGTTPTTTDTQTAPSGGAPAPEETGTATTTVPSGAAAPLP